MLKFYYFQKLPHGPTQSELNFLEMDFIYFFFYILITTNLHSKHLPVMKVQANVTRSEL